jgi:hypothetical protein
MSGIDDNEKKLAELILYVSQKCALEPRFGAVKLNKILYFADFFAYGSWGRAITGAEYQHLPNGPAPRRLLPVRKKLVEGGDLALQPTPLSGGKVQHRTVNLREPDLSLFDGREIALVDSMIDQLKSLNADETSELSHQMVGWEITRDYETIEYGTIFLSNPPLTPGEVLKGQSLAREMNMLA